MNDETFTIKNMSLDPNEIKKFSEMADDWWNPKGKFKPLHEFNPIRLSFIRETLCKHFNRPTSDKAPFKGLSLLDIGCGGGLLSEPMTRLGAKVTAIDPIEENIKTAALHAQQNGLKIHYLCNSIEELTKQGSKTFNIILNMEVIEHVANPVFFLQACSHLLSPGGLMVIATLNRTPKAYLKAILGAEYILGWLPKGTHDYKKFLKPEEIRAALEANPQITVSQPYGVCYSFFQRSWSLTQDSSVNFMMTATKISPL